MSNQLYKVEAQKESLPPAKLLYITAAKYGKDWHSTMHTHYYSEFLYVLRGRGRFLVEKTSFELRENDLVIVNPYVEHTETSVENQPLEYIVLGVDNAAFTFGALGSASGYRHFHYREQAAQINGYLKAMLQEAEGKALYHKAVCQNLLEIMLVHMIRLANFTMAVVPSRKMRAVSNSAKRYIDDHFNDAITLQTLADEMHVNKYHLAHSFTEDYGISPINYLIARRIEESKTLLKTTDLNISKVASFSGFSSQSYFSQCFRRLTGLSPKTYREQAKEQELWEEEAAPVSE
ncbi:MAG TPA: AraC family transcriptional regulator [Firmicutes bacterium]|nr:AraC family transcriptional regulator [Bacillota bacterium]